MPSISAVHGFVPRSNVLSPYCFAVGKIAGWSGCCGSDTLAGSASPGMMVTGRDGRSCERKLSRARAGEAL